MQVKLGGLDTLSLLRARRALAEEVLMNTNIGWGDRAIRIAIGTLLIAFAIPVGFPATGWNWIGWIGAIPLLTGLFGYCPLYAAFGLSTCPVRTVRRQS
jgi:hypothetical protein